MMDSSVLTITLKSKGQSEVVGSILIASLVIALIATAYVWGLPLVNKSSDANRIEYAQSVFEQVARAFESVTKEGGQKSINVNIDKGEIRLEKDELGEYTPTYTLTSDVKFFGASEQPMNDYTSPYVTELFGLNASGVGCGYSGTYTPAASCDRNGTATVGPATYSLCLCPVDTLFSPDYGNFTEGSKFPTASGTITVSHISWLDNITAFTGQTTTVPGLLGVNKAGVILAMSTPHGNIYTTRLRLKARTLQNPNTRETLRLNIQPAADSSVAAKGIFTITIKRVSTSTSVSGTKTSNIEIKME